MRANFRKHQKQYIFESLLKSLLSFPLPKIVVLTDRLTHYFYQAIISCITHRCIWNTCWKSQRLSLKFLLDLLSLLKCHNIKQKSTFWEQLRSFACLGNLSRHLRLFLEDLPISNWCFFFEISLFLRYVIKIAFNQWSSMTNTLWI